MQTIATQGWAKNIQSLNTKITNVFLCKKLYAELSAPKIR